jgi:soluble lytic murein transglycosylase-like protein
MKSRIYMEDAAVRIAESHGINPSIVLAMCSVESDWDPYAVRYEPKWRYFLNPAFWAKTVNTSVATETVLQSCSWGLMQVIGSVAREHGFKDDFPKLCEPEIGIEYGCKKLKACISRYSPLPDALAAYNAGKPGTTAGRNYASKILEKMDFL